MCNTEFTTKLVNTKTHFVNLWNEISSEMWVKITSLFTYKSLNFDESLSVKIVYPGTEAVSL